MSAYLAAFGITLGVFGALMHGVAKNSPDDDVATAWCRKWYGPLYGYALGVMLAAILCGAWQVAFWINR